VRLLNVIVAPAVAHVLQQHPYPPSSSIKNAHERLLGVPI